MTDGSSTAQPAVPTPFEVLVVCTANICRSPIAHWLLRRGFAASEDVHVVSAGLHARVGSPAAVEMTRLLGEPVDDFVARQLTGDMVESADLVLVMTREQRSSVVAASPAAVRRTFTLREFADLARLAQQPDLGPEEAGSGERLARLTALAPRLRTRRRPGPDDDVADPYGRGEDAHVQAFAEIQEAVEHIVSAASPGAAVPR